VKANLIAAVFIIATIGLGGRYHNIAPLLLLAALLSYIIFGPLYLHYKKRSHGTGTEKTQS
jgi:hypothetical protein